MAFWTRGSRRTYCNIKTGIVEAADSKQLWVSALDIGGSGDISHPAFYLRGQELAAGNIRAFAALEPCKDDGSPAPRASGGVCGPPEEEECSEIDQGCATAADCCDETRRVECIAGFCAVKAIIR